MSGREDAGWQAATAPARRSARIGVACRILAVLLCAIFVRAVGEFYHPGSGFTALIGFPQDTGDEPPVLRAVPHAQYPAYASYDGQFYATRALDPLLRDPSIDRYMDLAPYRARRILFSWTAYLAGLGRPAWILEAFALQNVVCWGLLAIVLRRWFDLRRPRGLALWAACLFAHGMLWSVRFALLDGPSLLLICVSVLLIEKGRPLAAAALTSVGVLGRETNVFAAVAYPIPATWRDWRRALAAAVLVVAPVLVWMDYLRSVYRSLLLQDTDQAAAPGSAFVWALQRTWHSVGTSGVLSFATIDLLLLVALAVQACYLAVRIRPHQPWWRVAVAYLALASVMDRVLWDPNTAAVTRVLLPLTVGFNVLLRDERSPHRFWCWFAVGNLHLLASPWVMPIL
ncbi:MAG TPA: hypothetical protein VG871_02795 [Vicinamibacterales bacterium]|nr:hypothetical protein [Vicinamibacterales bacterium]